MIHKLSETCTQTRNEAIQSLCQRSQLSYLLFLSTIVSENMKDKSGNRPKTVRAERLNSFCDVDAAAKVVLRTSRPNWSSCCSILLCLGIERVEELEGEGLGREEVGGGWESPSSSSSWESIQVDRLTTSRSLRRSC